MTLTKVTTSKCLHPLSRIGHCEYVIHFVHMKCAPLHITNVTCWRHGTLVVDVAQALVKVQMWVVWHWASCSVGGGFPHDRRARFKSCVGDILVVRNTSANGSVVFLRRVLQYAMSEECTVCQ